MKRCLFPLCFGLLIALVGSFGACHSGGGGSFKIVEGLLQLAGTGEPIPNVVIVTTGADPVTSDAQGRFLLEIATDETTVTLSLTGVLPSGQPFSIEVVVDLPEDEGAVVNLLIKLRQELTLVLFEFEIVDIFVGDKSQPRPRPTPAPTPVPPREIEEEEEDEPDCGNSDVEEGEECDDGVQPTASCDLDCTKPMCGDLFLNTVAGEQCDTGGVATADCDTDCTARICGDGQVNTPAGELCDPGPNESSSCDLDCTPALCGDGRVNAAAEEQCDTSGETVSCDANCTTVMCGDGTVNTAAGEFCDAFGVDTASCDRDCTAVVCGDAVENLPAGECDESSAFFCTQDCSGFIDF